MKHENRVVETVHVATMVERNIVASFTGQLFEAAATTKKWTSISSATASIQIVNIEEETHQIVGLDEDREVHKVVYHYSSVASRTLQEIPHLAVNVPEEHFQWYALLSAVTN